jgi:hypothetical protein
MFTGKWEVYAFDPDFDEKEETLEIVDADSRGRAVDQVYDKYNELHIPFKVRPYYGDYAKNKPPEPKLTPRAQLAKRIKKPPAALDYNFEIIDRSTNKPVDRFYAEEPRTAQAIFSRWLEIKGLPNDSEDYGYRPIARAQVGEPQPAGAVRDVEPNVAQNFGASRQNWELVSDEDPDRVVHRMNNATADEVRAWIAQQEAGGMPPGFLRTRIVGPTQTQARDANLEQSSAWTQARQWLQSVGAEPTAYSDFSVRPKMINQTTESLALTKKVLSELDTYFEAVVTPTKKQLGV